MSESGAASEEPGRRLTLLGELAVDGVAVGSPRSSAARIVAFVALCGASTRPRLAEALWPQAREGKAQGSLRTGLWQLRQRYPGLVTMNGPTVALGPDVWVDIHHLTAVGHRLLDATRADGISLLGACDCFANLLREREVLPGWYEDWVSHERERFRQLRLHMLEALSARLCRAGMFGMALEAALAARSADPLRESAHRAVVEVHLREGNLAEARRQYLHCLRTLKRELGVAPSPATVELGRRMATVELSRSNR